MRRLALLLLALSTLLLGCGSKSTSVVGKWKVDTTSVDGFKKLKPEAQQALRAGSLTFKSDKTMINDDGGGHITNGTWELKDGILVMTASGLSTTGLLNDDGKLHMRVGSTSIEFDRAGDE